ncbi:hypothetical protein SAMN06265795_110107 [Noviherbaspirillum humi]|uniref:Uncharacterized protein n=1 Tax=Noviherbaspirillum humi TaxID=1688639 RepID=A0A239IW83_9BURK|nr:hypothetical protein [Noviherbaspirillum humi]SNS96684.1 hypothetical protein SAMN06265795_110107 [Noviherbaspirillum humi]
MRYSAALICCLLLLASPANACLGLSLEDTIFFKTIPEPRPDADIIAKVSLFDADDGTAVARILQVLDTSDSRIHTGDKVDLKFRMTSCGPNLKPGEEGIIIAKARRDGDGRLVLHSYLRRYHDNRITPPSMAER